MDAFLVLEPRAGASPIAARPLYRLSSTSVPRVSPTSQRMPAELVRVGFLQAQAGAQQGRHEIRGSCRIQRVLVNLVSGLDPPLPTRIQEAPRLQPRGVSSVRTGSARSVTDFSWTGGHTHRGR